MRSRVLLLRVSCASIGSAATTAIAQAATTIGGLRIVNRGRRIVFSFERSIAITTSRGLDGDLRPSHEPERNESPNHPPESRDQHSSEYGILAGGIDHEDAVEHSD